MSFPAHTSNGIPAIRESSFDDYAAITALESQRGLSTKRHGEWLPLWTENPVYTTLRQHWPVGWVLEHNNRIVGSFSNIPILYEWNGRSILTATGRGWVTDTSYRGYAPLLIHEFLSQPNVDLCMSTTASLEASQILLAMGAAPVPVGSWDKREIWIVNYCNFLKLWLLRRRLPLALAYLLAPALFAKGTFTSKAIQVKSTEAKVGRCAAFDERFDEFWKSVRRQKLDSLLAVRTRGMLDWHFRNPLLQKKIWILTICDQERLVAYAIFLEREETDLDTSQLLLADFQALDDKDELIFPLLEAALEESRKENIYLLEKIGLCIGSRNVHVAPYVRKRACWSYYYKSSNRNLAKCLTNRNAWAPSLLDGDSTL